jgi:hypothetical protein
MVKARIISPGEVVPSSKADQMLEELNDLIESWSLEKLMILYDTIETFTPTPAISYTWGTGGTLNSARPTKLNDACYLTRSGGVIPLKLVSLGEFRMTNGNGQDVVAYSPEYPLGKLMIYPLPETSDVINVSSMKQLTGFATLVTSVDLAPGYRRALVSNLAMEISPSFGKKISSELATFALQAKEAIRDSNFRKPGPMIPRDLTDMVNGSRGFNILTGYV